MELRCRKGPIGRGFSAGKGNSLNKDERFVSIDGKSGRSRDGQLFHRIGIGFAVALCLNCSPASAHIGPGQPIASATFAEPQVDVVRGFNLDGHDGNGPFPGSTRPHKNYASPAGEQGIDNLLFTVQGCIEGWRQNGSLPMIDGVIHIDPLDRIYMHEGPAATWIMRQARMRLQIEEDGSLKDPHTGEFTGISGAYEIEGVPAFIPRQQQARADGRPTRS